MITDLERNDLGKICQPGSIHVSKLTSIESYAHQHHQVSEIRGSLRKEIQIADVIRALFPGGSITGAPKQKAIEIIQALEPHPRNVYCGSIGYVSRGQKAQFNIAIRTMILKNQKAYYYAGGGIVMDSVPEAEYQETLVKAKGMMEALA
ncbi:MAG: chorismate-binding protein [Deltaproteobacteria bacterium]|nr:MAG: chorismate-binding protein [Deltaproteobacteria bacterium]